MRTKWAGLIVAMLAGALALPASAPAASKIYGGTTEGGGNLAFDVAVNRKGKPKRITEIRATNLPTECETSGPVPSYTTFTGTLKVTDKRYAATYTQETYGNQSSIEGKFGGKKKRKASGTMVFDYHFPEDLENGYPEEDCSTGEIAYTVKRGGPDVQTPAARPLRR